MGQEMFLRSISCAERENRIGNDLVTAPRTRSQQVFGSTTIDNVCHGRDNNFDAIRFVAAAAVILSHAYPLSLGTDRSEPLAVITRGQITLGWVAVAVFFVVSGFLITLSYERSQSLPRFVRARALRILPGLAAVTFVTVFAIGPVTTTLSLPAYLSDSRTYSFLLSAVPLSINRVLPGVFTRNAFPNVVNGSLWTLEAETLCYAAVAILGFVKGLRPPVALALLVGLMLMPYAHLPDRVGLAWRWESDLELARFFAAGMCLYLFRRWIPLNGRLAVAALLGAVLLALSARGLIPGLLIFGSYLVVWLAFNKRIDLSGFAQKKGDLSYGMYIYAFPIQQSVMLVGGASVSPLINFLVSFALVVPCAFASWHLVEQPALRLKNSHHMAVRLPLVKGTGWGTKSRAGVQGKVITECAGRSPTE